MPSLADVAIGLFLAYYWTGFDMVQFHSQQSPIDRPGYVDNPVWKLALSGAAWPIVTFVNQELAWFGVCFLSAATVFSVLHAALLPYLGSTALVVFVIAVIRMVPVVSAVLNLPLALLATIFWFVFAKPFGAKPPAGMDRLGK